MKYNEWREKVMQNPKVQEAYKRLRFHLLLSNLWLRFRIFCQSSWEASEPLNQEHIEKLNKKLEENNRSPKF